MFLVLIVAEYDAAYQMLAAAIKSVDHGVECRHATNALMAQRTMRAIKVDMVVAESTPANLSFATSLVPQLSQLGNRLDKIVLVSYAREDGDCSESLTRADNPEAVEAQVRETISYQDAQRVTDSHLEEF